MHQARIHVRIWGGHQSRGINRSVRSAVFNRSFFRTDNGYMGLAPVGAGPTGEIFVLLGGQMPFVLRSVDKPTIESSGERECYGLIGTCYRHGVMDGKLVKNSRERIEDVYLI
ncbi:hypothetical protein K469DRAFT_764542 [Zopfia rhizophila CBS 207.26]|uniref:Uncharacterized protein n=1 Tax=Zopfia rhizophila CBS 207.26 TaxID=1314779 RepID=A0A6A6EE97_9PEZI|nr:hypothetical protein K469DRAFT_764542 [Zopfia rhizophila CBS 207.26]